MTKAWTQIVPDSTLKTLETPAVEVVDRFSADDLQKRSTAAGTVIFHHEIQQMSPEDLGDLTSRFSGVFVRSYGGAGGLKTLNARGLGSQHFLVVNNQQALLFNQMGSANLGDIQADGLLSVTYSVGGSDAWDVPTLVKTYSGVLHLKYLELNHNQKDFIQLQALGASFGRYKLTGNWLKNTRRATCFAQAYAYQMQGEFPFEYQHGLVNVEGVRLNNFTREATARFGGNYYLNTYNKLQFAVQYLNAFRELPGAIVFYHPNHFQTLGNQQINGSLKHEYDKALVKVNHYANLSRTKTTYIDSFHIVRPRLEMYQEDNLDFGQNGQLDWDYFKLNWSGQYVYSALETSRAEILMPKRHRALGNLGVEYLGDALKLRIDLPLQFVSDQLVMNPNQNRLLFTPSFGANKTWGKKRRRSVLRASVGQFARLATFSEMYYGQMGNPDLRPEISQMINLGFHHKSFTNKVLIGFGVDAFYGQIKDKIIAIPTQNLFIWSVRNLQTVRAYGFDAMFTAELQPTNWKSKINFTQKSSLNIAQDISNPESPTFGHQIPYTPYWLHNSELTWTRKNISATYNYSFNDFRFVLGENIAANVLDAFHLHDFRINYAFKTKEESKHNWRIHLKCNNILNQQYQVMRGFPMPGRNFEFGLTWRF